MYGGCGCIDPHILVSALVGVEWAASQPGHFTLRQRWLPAFITSEGG
jgi:hypothetical protein